MFPSRFRPEQSSSDWIVFFKANRERIVFVNFAEQINRGAGTENKVPAAPPPPPLLTSLSPPTPPHPPLPPAAPPPLAAGVLEQIARRGATTLHANWGSGGRLRLAS